MIKKVSFFVCLGFILTIFLAQFDPWVHTKLIRWCQCIAVQSLSCDTKFVIESLNFFSPSLVLCDVEMTDVSHTWSWKCKRLEVYSSWIQLLFKGTLEKHIIIDEFESTSLVQDGVCAIEQHIVALTAQSLFPLPSEVKSMIFKKSHMFFSHNQKNMSVSLFFNSSSLRIAEKLKTMMSMYDGCIKYNDTMYSTDVTADISLITWYEKDNFMCTVNGSGLLHIPQMADQGMCYVSGFFDAWHGRFSLRNAYNSFIIDPIIMTEQEIKVDCCIPLRYILNCLDQYYVAESVDADIHSSIRIDKKEGRINGHLVVQDGVIGKTPVCDVAKMVFSRRDNTWKFRLNVARKNEECSGSGFWNEQLEQGYCELHNNTKLSTSFMPNWHIMPKDFTYHIFINQQESTGIYKIDSTNVLSKAQHTLFGGFSYQDSNFMLNGLLDCNEFCTKIQIGPALQLLEGFVVDKDKKNLLLLRKEDKNNHFCADISFVFIRNFINTFFHYDIQGEGIFTIQSTCTPDGIEMDVASEDVTIRLPETYNFIDELRSRVKYNIAKKRIILKNTFISLHSGTLQSPYAIITFDNNNQCVFAHTSILFDRCLFNVKKDLFATVSGNLHCFYNKPEDPLIKGHIIVDRGQLKENIFSSIIQKKIFEYTPSAFSFSHVPIMCDLVVETKSPIRVDTAFLQTNVKVKLALSNRITEPTVAGNIILQSGVLNFPYKPLIIHKGSLTFSPGQLYDPTVELIARNKVKNFDISLQVVGSLLDHHIMLDSTPALSEEHIMTLLLVGSQESSLNSMIPALIVQNLKSLIFSHNQSTFVEKYFVPLLRPFHINIVPSFADQTGRGGLRGMLEVNINDRWRALLQKNFSLTEDTRVELEFSVSDDISLRGIRDERRDLAGEVEMRWKF